jgi:hypothetical protein
MSKLIYGFGKNLNAHPQAILLPAQIRRSHLIHDNRLRPGIGDGTLRIPFYRIWGPLLTSLAVSDLMDLTFLDFFETLNIVHL